MGDISSPKRRDVFERLRRRIDFYKRHHNNTSARYDNNINSLYERERQESLLLRDRWLQSKAKKASKSKKDSSAGEHRNLGLTVSNTKNPSNSFCVVTFLLTFD